MTDVPTTTTPSDGFRRGEALVEVNDVFKSYRRGPEEVHALVGAHLTLRVGEVVALMGPSGSGKTTLLNVLCGWEHPDGGSVAWPGSPNGDLPAERRPWRDIAIVPQDLGLLEELSVRENVGLPVRLAEMRDDPQWAARIDRLLEVFGLEPYADRQPGEISLGEQQRVALSRAMILLPKLLLADEPTGHQDAEWARTVFRGFRWAASRGTTSLIATHSREFLRFVDRVVLIRDGRLHEDDAPR